MRSAEILGASDLTGARDGRQRLDRRVFRHGQVLGLFELTAVAHLPYDEAIPGLDYAGAAAVAPPPGVASGPWHQHFEEDGDAWL